ncbi:MAG: hypothetical protein ACREU6_01250, partial [Steroidobacteraceae bacterium]
MRILNVKMMSAVFLVLAVVLMPISVKAQNKPTDRPDLSGIWISPSTSPNDPRWTIENRVCYLCALPALERLHTLLNDPNSASRSVKEIAGEFTAFDEQYVNGLLTHQALAFQASFNPEDDPILACKPAGLLAQAY